MLALLDPVGMFLVAQGLYEDIGLLLGGRRGASVMAVLVEHLSVPQRPLHPTVGLLVVQYFLVEFSEE